MGKYNLFKSSPLQLSIVSGFFNSISFRTIAFLILIISILLIVNDFKKNTFLAMSFFASYLLFYCMYILSFLNVFIYSNYIWIANLIIGLTCIYFVIIKLIDKDKIKLNKMSKSNVKIDVPLPLVFFIVFIAFILSSIRFSLMDISTSKFLENLLNSGFTEFCKYFCLIFYIISFATIPFCIIFSTPILIKLLGKKYNINSEIIGNGLLLISSIIVALL